MKIIEDILQLKMKPKEKQASLVEAVISRKIPVKEFFDLIETADWLIPVIDKYRFSIK